eukprot:TRINITY_DN4824_c0_g1_i1.p1 TRINITY_DN4824_c0_g1~~TRINITY_DN4824_c0_g1_i1.p1  ORF type:complete len:1157 (+),score=342.41 TRINITY_DN4824_c0_g1_i1:62-3472(+)
MCIRDSYSKAVRGNTGFAVQYDGRGWPNDATAVLMTTSFSASQIEERVISDSSDETLKSKYNYVVKTALSFNHYGDTGPVKTGAGDMEIRGEVGIYGANQILIQADTKADIGCFISILPGNANTKFIANNIEIVGCGQDSQSRAAVNFASLVDGTYTLTNSVIRNNRWYAINLLDVTKTVTLKGNFIYTATEGGVRIKNSESFDLTENLIANLKARKLSNVQLLFAAGVNFDTAMRSTKFTMKSNSVVASELFGYFLWAPECGAASPFTTNIAHSSVIGVYVARQSSSCAKFSSWTLFKNVDGFFSHDKFDDFTLENSVFSDNRFSVTINTWKDAQTVAKLSISNNYIAGLSYLENCPECYDTPADCTGIHGIRLSIQSNDVKSFPFNVFQMPLHNPQSEQLTLGQVTVTGVEAKLFLQESSRGCRSNYFLRTNEYAMDWHHPHLFSAMKTETLDKDALIYMDDPKNDWVGIECPGRQCTGLKNFIVQDVDGSLRGKSTGVIIPNNPLSVSLTDCTFNANWNGFDCTTPNYCILAIENFDPKKLKNPVTNVQLKSKSGLVNSIEPFAKRRTSNRRQLFLAVVKTGEQYSVIFNQGAEAPIRWDVWGIGCPSNANIQISYSRVSGEEIRVNLENGKEITTLSVIGGQYDSKKLIEACGNNVIDPSDKSIIVNLIGNCKVTVKQVNAVNVKMQIEQPTEKITQADIERYVQKVALQLNVTQNNVKIVQVTNSINVNASYLDFRIDSRNQNETYVSRAELAQELRSIYATMLNLTRNQTAWNESAVSEIAANTTLTNVAKTSPVILANLTVNVTQNTTINTTNVTDGTNGTNLTITQITIRQNESDFDLPTLSTFVRPSNTSVSASALTASNIEDGRSNAFKFDNDPNYILPAILGALMLLFCLGLCCFLRFCPGLLSSSKAPVIAPANAANQSMMNDTMNRSAVYAPLNQSALRDETVMASNRGDLSFQAGQAGRAEGALAARPIVENNAGNEDLSITERNRLKANEGKVLTVAEGQAKDAMDKEVIVHAGAEKKDASKKAIRRDSDARNLGANTIIVHEESETFVQSSGQMAVSSNMAASSNQAASSNFGASSSQVISPQGRRPRFVPDQEVAEEEVRLDIQDQEGQTQKFSRPRFN